MPPLYPVIMKGRNAYSQTVRGNSFNVLVVGVISYNVSSLEVAAIDFCYCNTPLINLKIRVYDRLPQSFQKPSQSGRTCNVCYLVTTYTHRSKLLIAILVQPLPTATALVANRSDNALCQMEK